MNVILFSLCVFFFFCQLVLPQFLKAVPVYINSLRKSEVLLPGLRSSVHQRLQLRSLIVSMDTLSTASQFYPLILPLVRDRHLEHSVHPN